MSDENQTPELPKALKLPSLANLNPALAFITHYWKAIVFALLLLLMGYQYLRIDSLKQSVIAEQQKVIAAEQRLVTCNQKVTEQSDRIKELSTISKDLNDQVAALKPLLERIGRDTGRTVDKIMNEKTPQTCEEIRDYIISNQADYGWKDTK